MTDHGTGLAVQPFDDDLELITAYLQDRLDPERVAVVRRRLEDDADFRHMAAPLVWAWNVPPRWEMEPVTRVELEQRWDEFTRRAGFVHQRRRTRRRRLNLLGALLLLLGTGAWVARAPLGAWYHDLRDYHTVAPGAEWTTVGDRAEVRVEEGSELRVMRVAPDTGTDIVKLAGSGAFRVMRPRTNPHDAAMRPFRVSTRAAAVTTVRATFEVHASGDTTIVAVLVPEAEEYLGLMVLPTFVHVEDLQGGAVVLRERQRARIINGNKPEVLP